ncbi:MAG: hypothetical protein HC936_11405 [Leptolyngbyaceae cyanobacterium SU_3_3]|nr:hypothetical protein [Leptolyngbyaceae cyanobacterium SU_3_3]
MGYATAPNGQQIIQEAKADQGAIAAGSASAAGAAALSLNVPAGGVPAGGAPAGGAPVAEATASPEAVASPVPIVAPTVAAAPNGTASPTTPSPTVAPNGAIAPSPGSATGVATSRAEMGGIPPWLWLLPLGLFGLLLWWLFGNGAQKMKRSPPPLNPPPLPSNTTVSSEPILPPEPLNPASRAESVINSDRAEIAEIHPPADRSMAASPEGWDNLSPELAGGAALAAGAGAAAWAERSPTHAPETDEPILGDWPLPIFPRSSRIEIDQPLNFSSPDEIISADSELPSDPAIVDESLPSELAPMECLSPMRAHSREVQRWRRSRLGSHTPWSHSNFQISHNRGDPSTRRAACHPRHDRRTRRTRSDH